MRHRTHVRRTISVTAAAALGLLGTAAFAAPASAADIHDVDTEDELADAIDTAISGDVIHLTGTGFSLTADLPPIDTNLSIVGPGSASFTIDGDGHEVFDLVGTAEIPPAVSISGIHITDAPLTIRSTNANLVLDDIALDSAGLEFGDGDLEVTDSSFCSSSNYGAWIHVADDDIVRVEDSTFDDNVGVGLALGAVAFSSAHLTNLSSTGSNVGFALTTGNDAQLDATGLTASSSTLEGIRLDAGIRSKVTFTNTTSTGNHYEGIRAVVQSGATATFDTVTVSGNHHSGMEVTADYTSSVTINDAVAQNNGQHGFEVSADGEGAVAKVALHRITAADNDEAGVFVDFAERSEVTVTDADLRGNSPGLQLGGSSYGGTLTVDRATIAGNSRIGGGGVSIDGADGVTIAISDSTISGNHSLGSAGVSAHLDEDSSLSIVNSTVSGNLADSDVAAIGVTIAPDSGASFTLAHSTVTDNESPSGGAVGITGGEATIHDTIVAGNAPGTGVDLSFENVAGTIDYSLLGTLSPDAQTAAEAGTGNVLGQPAGLGPLADNGGPTLTHLPLATSPALNAGNPGITGAPATDQRGSARIVGTIDIGAVEAPVAIPPALAATGLDPNPALLSGVVALGAGMLLLAGAAWRRSGRYR